MSNPAPPRPRRRRPSAVALQGSLWLEVEGRPLGGSERMALLKAVAEQGSITQGAQAVGISYKGAWDAIDAMNELAGEPLVERTSGGRGGGGTRLTDHGQRLVARFEQLSAAHQRFVQLLSTQGMDLDQAFSFLRVVNIKTSARNQWVGTVSAIRAGAVNDEVELLLPGGARLVAIVTRESTDALGLRVKQTVIALVKSSAVMLATDLGDARLSTRNRFDGVVCGVRPGAVNAEVTVETADGLRIVAIVTQASVDGLGLAPGQAATALLKASDVILACES
ncbi:MAG: TOBE domain-containing protein [Burkholderiaceae bacterium]|nr:TOBE domain-containing protein [Burkholderiaceae bacterium]